MPFYWILGPLTNAKIPTVLQATGFSKGVYSALENDV